MGRPETPLNPQVAGPVRELAAGLRELRRAAGQPPYRRMAASTYYSASTLARAASGTGLPSWQVTLAYVTACGGDATEWQERWQRANAALSPDPVDEFDPPTAGDPPPGPLVPRQLPAAPRLCVGRGDEIRNLDAILAACTAVHPAPMMVSAIAGSAGIGKTALAVHWAHRVRDRFPDGQLYVDLQGYDPDSPVTPDQALSHLLRSLDVPAERISGELDAMAALYRSVLTGRRVLVLLDNANSTSQVRPLLPGSPGSLVIVTSRSRLSGLIVHDGAHRVTLDVLSSRDAVALLAEIIGGHRVAAEPDAAAELARRCAYLPLALRVAAERVASRPHLSLADLVDELTVERDRLDVLTAGDEETNVRTVFSWSYHAIPPTAARIFRLLGLHLGPDISVPAAAELADVQTSDARKLLDILANQHLLEEVARDRYRQHDLLRVYAAERAEAEEDRQSRDLAVSRMLTWYMSTTDAAGRALLPQRRYLPLRPSETGRAPLAFESRRHALDWCARELPNLVAATRQAVQCGHHRIAWKIPTALWPFLNLRKPWSEWVETHRLGLQAARDGHDEFGYASVLTAFAHALLDLRRFDEAADALREALEIWERIGYVWGRSAAQTLLGMVHQELRNFDDAIAVLHAARAGFQETDDMWGQGWALRHLGESYQDTELSDDAIHHTLEALAIFRRIGDRWSQGWSLHTLGRIFHSLGRFNEARDYFHQALAIRRETNDLHGESITLHALGIVAHEAGDSGDAKESWRQALTIFERLGDPTAAKVRARLRDAV